MTSMPVTEFVFPVIVALSATLVGCATTPKTTARSARGYLRFEVVPEDAEIEIDEQYSGVVNGWAQHVVPVEAGDRRVTVRAAGYITQRFDIEVAANEEVTLRLKLEPSLELEPATDAPPDPRDRFRPRLGARR